MKRLSFFFLSLIIFFIFYSLFLTYGVVSTGNDTQQHREVLLLLTQESTELRAQYLKILFSKTLPQGFVAVESPRYVKEKSSVAQAR